MASRIDVRFLWYLVGGDLVVTLKAQIKKIDRSLLAFVIGLTCFGVLMVYDASAVTAFRDFGDKFFYAKQQVLWAGLGFLVLFIASKFDYRKLSKLASSLMLITIALLIAVLVPSLGTRALGARRWLSFAGISFQPSELAKLASILYLSSFLQKKKNILPFIAPLAVLIGLIMLQPDLGTAVVIMGTGLCLYFISGASLLALFFLTILALILGITLILSSSYRKERLLTFLNLTRDPLGASYHVRQVLLALGSGGLFGLGLGQSRQKYEYLPEAMTDSIFAIIGEEIGFIGALVLILAFLFIVWRGLKIAREAPDSFGQLLAAGISSWIGIQTLVNLAAMVVIVPLTGVPLPLISYGGSSLVAVLAGIGILLNISKQRVTKK